MAIGPPNDAVAMQCSARRVNYRGQRTRRFLRAAPVAGSVTATCLYNYILCEPMKNRVGNICWGRNSQN